MWCDKHCPHYDPLLSLGTKDLWLIERERIRAIPSLKTFKSKSKSCDYPEVDASVHNRSRPHQLDEFPRTIVASTFRRHSGQRVDSFYDPGTGMNGTDHSGLGRKKVGAVTTNGGVSGNEYAGLPNRMRQRHDHGRRMQKRQSWPSFYTDPREVTLQPSAADDEDEEGSEVLSKKVLRQKVDGLLDFLISERDHPDIMSASLSGLLPPLACCLKLSPADVSAVYKGQRSKVADRADPDHGVLQTIGLMKECGYSVLEETPFRVEMEKSLLKVHFHVKVKNEPLLRQMESRYAVLEVSMVVGMQCPAHVSTYYA